MSKRRECFAEGQKYRISSSGIPMGIAKVVEYDGQRVTFEFSRNGRIVRFTERILKVGWPSSESCVSSEYDVIYSYNAIKGDTAHGV